MIDVHTHLFNAAYVPIEGAVLSRVRHLNPAADLPLRLLRLILRPAVGELARVLRGATRLDDPGAVPPPLPCTGPPRDLEELAYEAVKEADLPATEEITRIGRYPGVRAAARLAPAQPHYGNAFRGWRESPSPEAAELGQQAGVVLAAANSSGLLPWLMAILGRESRLAQELYCLWGDGVDRFVVHMLDMGPHYRGECLPFEEQVERTGRLLEAYPKLLGFVAWCPIRTSSPARDGKPPRRGSLEIVQAAIGSGRFRGVKFYPPSGYRPAGNRRVPRGKAKEIDAANEALFEWCAAEGVPVFTHCAPGDMEYARGAGAYFAHPKHWIPVLERHPDLRLCLGHAGGEACWFEPDGHGRAGWRDTVVRLCLDHPNVYCEFGPHDGDRDPEQIARFQDRLARLAADSTAAPFLDRICFGSDYHLLLRHPRATEYASLVRTIFSDPRLAPFQERFFDANARRWLEME